MNTIFLDNKIISLPQRFHPGQVLTETQAMVLVGIDHKRILARLRWLLNRGELRPEEAQAKANELALQPFVGQMTADDTSEDDPIFVEALAIAKEMIISRLAAEGIPPPKGIDAHAKALLDGAPVIMEKARLRLEARYAAASAALSGVTAEAI